jgi:hypothetical protein
MRFLLTWNNAGGIDTAYLERGMPVAITIPDVFNLEAPQGG